MFAISTVRMKRVCALHAYYWLPRWLICAVMAGFFCLGLPTRAQHTLQAFTAHYQARYNGMQGQGTVSLQTLENGHWRYTMTLRNAFARIRQSTVFTQVDDVLRPLHNISDARILFKRRVVEGHYDWDTRQAIWTGDTKEHRRGPIALEDGDMDGLLLNLAVVRDLAQGQPLRYRLVENGRAVPLEYQTTGTQQLTVHGQSVQATRLERTERNKQQIAWVVPGMTMPVRLLQREDGKDTMELVLVCDAVSTSGS